MDVTKEKQANLYSIIIKCVNKYCPYFEKKSGPKFQEELFAIFNKLLKNEEIT